MNAGIIPRRPAGGRFSFRSAGGRVWWTGWTQGNRVNEFAAFGTEW